MPILLENVDYIDEVCKLGVFVNSQYDTLIPGYGSDEILQSASVGDLSVNMNRSFAVDYNEPEIV